MKVCRVLAGAALPAALFLLPAAAVRAADTPAVTVVREFLADRAAGRYAAAYALLSFQGIKQAKNQFTENQFTEKQFAAGSLIPPELASQASPALFGIFLLFFDTHNTRRRLFAVLGPDPADAKRVLVRVSLPPAAKGAASVTVRIVTAAASPHLLCLDLAGSLRVNAPPLSAEQKRENQKLRQDIGRMRSQNQLKYLAVAITEYAQRHNGTLPDAARWMDEIAPFLPDTTYFQNPALPQKYGYAYNAALSGRELAALSSPDKIVLVFESTKNRKNAADAGESVPRPGRHQGGTDFLFAGGLVQWVPDGTKVSFQTGHTLLP